MSRRIGGYIGAKPTWTTVSTSGVFSLRDVTKLKADGQWPRGPEAPTNLTATADIQQVSLSWTPPAAAHGSITDYRIELSADGGMTWAAVSDGVGTTTSLTVSPLASNTTYTFRVAAVNHTAGDWSDAVSATTLPYMPQITITSQPTNQTASSGTATFSIAAAVTESASLSYQWQKKEGGVGPFSNVSGATSSSLALTGLTNAADNGDVYRCVVSAVGYTSSVTSNSATLTVPIPAFLTVSGSIYPSNVNLNGTYLLEESLADGRPSYRKDASAYIRWDSSYGYWTVRSVISNQDQYVHYKSADTPLPPAGGGWYAPWGGTPVVAYPYVAFTQQPTSQIAAGGAATFSVTAVSQTVSPTYQWQKQEGAAGEFTNVSGATSSSLALTNLTNAADDGDVYRVVVSESANATSVTSDAVALTVPPQTLYATGSTFSGTGPNDAVVSANGAYALESSLTGGKPSYRKDAYTLIYWNAGYGRWDMESANYNNQQVLVHYKSQDTVLPPPSGWQNISGGGTLVISTSPPLPVITITTQPANQAASYGTATFSVAATVTEGATLSYQWQKQENGAGSFSNVSGGTGPILVLTQLTSADDNGDVYRCVVSATGGAQNVTSNSATLTVTLNNCPLPGGGQTLCGFTLSGAPIEWGSYPPAYSGYASLNGSYVDENTYYGGSGPQPGNMWVSAGDGNWAIWYSSNHGVCTCYDASGNVVGTRQLSGWGLIWVPTWTLRAYAPGSLAGIPPSTNWYHIYDDGYGGGATCSRDVHGNGTVVGFQDCDPSVLPPTSPYHPGYAASLTFTPA